MTNVLTGMRIVCSILLLFCPALSSSFFIFYITAGITDMVDGTIARKTNTVSEFGSKFDTVVDFIFVMVSFIKLFPVLDIDVWVYVWVALIAAIKISNIVFYFIRLHKLVAVHSVLNKLVGALLFVMPLTLTFVDSHYSAAVVCCFATVAAVREGCYFKKEDRALTEDEIHIGKR